MTAPTAERLREIRQYADGLSLDLAAFGSEAGTSWERQANPDQLAVFMLLDTLDHVAERLRVALVEESYFEEAETDPETHTAARRVARELLAYIAAPTTPRAGDGEPGGAAS